ncbi:MAG: sodium-translocating pyrophosphatase [Armatimonadetes bacterium]|nr:sodium-translocating pyrophosphatase [Armatimonadota bacterium]CUU37750.1 K(+)-stimulated pyrophosphate-energized sodium pump [Armatimonadetes bacterium DC]
MREKVACLAGQGNLARLGLLAFLWLWSSTGVFAAEAVQLPPFGSQEYLILAIVLGMAFVALGYGFYLMRWTLAQDPGTPKMQEVAKAIQDGANAYLKRQISTMIWFVLAITVGLFVLYRPVYERLYPGEGLTLAVGIAVAFFLGVFASYGAGYVGMYMAVRGNLRTAAKALTTFKGALETAFRAGAVSGMFTVGLGLLGATIIFLLFRDKAMFVLVGFGFGGSLAALFMRVGGGIYTKGADVGADLVGKVEAGIPEDDPRNPATIADNVGDNVGDCAGMAADVFESYEVTLVAAIILGVAASVVLTPESAMKLVMFALLVRGVGILASIIGVQSVKGEDRADLNPMKPINRGFWVSAILAALGNLGVAYFFMQDVTLKPDLGGTVVDWWRFWVATSFGIVVAVLIERITEYFTSTEKKPVKEISAAASTGPATLIIQGFAYGLESSVWAVFSIALALLAPLFIFPPGEFGGPMLSFYGIALTGLGLLATTGYILAMDTFGPISDNANGIFEMSGALKEQGNKPAAGGLTGDRIVHRLDSVGNTTKALTKGFAIATAVVAAVALFHSFVEDSRLVELINIATQNDVALKDAFGGLPVDVPIVFIGLLIGGAAPFLFSAFSILAVGRSAFEMIHEVRRQFREKPGIMAGTETPDYGRCVAIVTAAAQKELLGPGILAIALPVAVGFGLSIGASAITIGGREYVFAGAQALGGYLAGAILSAQLLAVLLANSGGAWDNAKKRIEDGFLGGKGTDAHKAGVIGDTVGDPFKDTAGPALNPLIKVMNLVAILIAPIVIQPLPDSVRIAVTAVAVAALAFSVYWSKRGSIAETIEHELGYHTTEEPEEAGEAAPVGGKGSE